MRARHARPSSKSAMPDSDKLHPAEPDAMNLVYTDGQKKFRAEIRSWLKEHVPATPLKSFDTEQGFAEHRAWERVLYSSRWSMVTWPQALGGRGCDLIEWLIF